MQATCLVFPSPQKYNLQPILYKIVLIPQDPNDNIHVTYHHYLNLCSLDQNDDFQKVIKHLNNEYMLKTRDQTQYQKRNNILSEDYRKTQQNIKNYHTVTTRESDKENIYVEKSDKRKYSGSAIEANLTQNSVNSQQYIPCLFLPGKKDKIIVFFHANAQDITSSFEFLKMINIQTQYSILAMEYRGYSVNKGQTDAQLISKDANRVIQYLLNRKISNQQIIIFGRSIGCAIALGAMKEQLRVHALVLLSPFLSLKKIAQQLYGNCAGWALKQGFDNQKNSLNIQSPLLLIHGMKDTLVPYEHSLALFSQCRSYCQLKLIQAMSHSRFNFRLDFIKHFQLFINDLQQRLSE